jgi:hypothetical protein
LRLTLFSAFLATLGESPFHRFRLRRTTIIAAQDHPVRGQNRTA